MKDFMFCVCTCSLKLEGSVVDVLHVFAHMY